MGRRPYLFCGLSISHRNDNNRRRNSDSSKRTQLAPATKRGHTASYPCPLALIGIFRIGIAKGNEMHGSFFAFSENNPSAANAPIILVNDHATEVVIGEYHPLGGFGSELFAFANHSR